MPGSRCQKDSDRGAQVLYRRRHGMPVMVYPGGDRWAGKESIGHQVPCPGRLPSRKRGSLELGCSPRWPPAFPAGQRPPSEDWGST
jgi:hypothetical protein